MSNSLPEQSVFGIINFPRTRLEAEEWTRGWVRAMSGGFHPDTSFGNYVITGGVNEGDPSFKGAYLVAALENCRQQAFALLGEEIYEIGIDEMQKQGWAPASPST